MSELSMFYVLLSIFVKVNLVSKLETYYDAV